MKIFAKSYFCPLKTERQFSDHSEKDLNGRWLWNVLGESFCKSTPLRDNIKFNSKKSGLTKFAQISVWIKCLTSMGDSSGITWHIQMKSYVLPIYPLIWKHLPTEVWFFFPLKTERQVACQMRKIDWAAQQFQYTPTNEIWGCIMKM